MTLPPLKVVPVFVVTFGVLLTLVFGYLATQGGPLAYVAAPLLIAGGALFLITTNRPLLLFPIVAVLSTFIYAVPLAGAQVIAADLVVGCIVLTWATSSSRLAMTREAWRVVVPLAALVIMCLATVPVSHDPRFGLVKVIQRVEFLLFLAGCAALLRDRIVMRRTLDAYIYACVALAVVTLLFAAARGVPRGGVTDIFFYNKNSIASFMSMGLPVVAARFLFKASPHRLRWVMLALLLIVALLLTGSRGAWIGTIVALGVLTGLKNKASLTRYIAVGVIALIALNSLLPSDLTRISDISESYSATLSSPTANADVGGTVLSRLVLWRDALKIIAAHPYLGVGVGGYISFDSYGGNTINFNSTDPHNSFLYMWAELGTPGLIIFVWLLASILRSANAARRMTRGSPDYWLAAGCLSAIVSYLVFTLTEPIWVRGDGLAFFLLVGMTINLAAGSIGQAGKTDVLVPGAAPPRYRGLQGDR